MVSSYSSPVTCETGLSIVGVTEDRQSSSCSKHILSSWGGEPGMFLQCEAMYMVNAD